MAFQHMDIFEVVPENFFSILTSPNKRLYVQALFVLRDAFKTELLIRRDDLNAMLISSMENTIISADFSADENPDSSGPTAGKPDSGATVTQGPHSSGILSGGSGSAAGKQAGSGAGIDERATRSFQGNQGNDNLSARIHFLVRKLRDTGWLEIETERGTFEENITIPDYAIAIIDILHDLSTERVREYNSYVFATYATLKSVADTPDFAYTALNSAYNNTTKLVDELKTLYNNIRRYNQRVLNETNVNNILAEHFDRYKEQIYNAVYYPLKTIDSIPRFKNSILAILNSWLLDDEMINTLVAQGRQRHAFSKENYNNADVTGSRGRSGTDENLRTRGMEPDSEISADIADHDNVITMINTITDIYDSVEKMIDDIDNRQTEYTRASVEKISYFMNVDQSVKGRLVNLLHNSGNKKILGSMEESIRVWRHCYYDSQSPYTRVKRTKRSEGRPLALSASKLSDGMISDFLDDVRRQYTNKKIDDYVMSLFDTAPGTAAGEISTEEIRIEGSEDFIMFLLGTIRGREKTAPYSVQFAEFSEDNVDVSGYSLPEVKFLRKSDSKSDRKSDRKPDKKPVKKPDKNAGKE